MKKVKKRLDLLLLERGVFDTITRVQGEILSGTIYEKKSGKILDKPGQNVNADLEIEIRSRTSKFVSRSGEKLQGFLDFLNFSVTGKVGLDIGSSTGGFTDCLLQQGAKKVFCVDVGTHQLHENLRADPRVKFFENLDARKISLDLFDERPEIVMIDVSFISVRLILPSLADLFPRADFLLLFKPSFEAARTARREKGGVVREDERLKALEDFKLWLCDQKWEVKAIQDSILKGAEGNQETFFWIRVS